MAEVTIENPDVHKTDAKVDDRGRVYVGSKYSGQRVRVVVEAQNNDED